MAPDRSPLRTQLPPSAPSVLPLVVLESHPRDRDGVVMLRTAPSRHHESPAYACYASPKPISRLLTPADVVEMRQSSQIPQ